MTITLTREEAQQVLDALDEYRDSTEDFRVANRCISLIETLRARLAQPEQEWKYNRMTGEPLVDGWPLYSGLPKREWQGLTNEEIHSIPMLNKRHYARAMEAKLKEKNT
jgi:hypothetical protein